MSIKEQAKKEIEKLEKINESIDQFLEQAPPGFLKCQNKKGHPYYYHQYREDETQPWMRKYINKKELSLAKRLAQKQYDQAIKPVLEKNIKSLKKFVKEYQTQEIEEIYNKLTADRKSLIVPIQVSKEERIHEWQEEVYEKNTAFPENLRYETAQGEYVRSKSEVIIANILYQHRRDILYKYERPLKLMVDGKEKIIYPDFTILNIHTGQIVYWEHAGLMSDLRYVDDTVRKMNIYIMNNLAIGRDVVFTFESLSNMLEIGVVKTLVEEIRKQ